MLRAVMRIIGGASLPATTDQSPAVARKRMTSPPSGPQVGPLDSRAARLFVVLAAFLACNAMIAEFVGVKIFALEPSLGLDSFDWNLFGQSGSLSFTSR